MLIITFYVFRSLDNNVREFDKIRLSQSHFSFQLELSSAAICHNGRYIDLFKPASIALQVTAETNGIWTLSNSNEICVVSTIEKVDGADSKESCIPETVRKMDGPKISDRVDIEIVRLEEGYEVSQHGFISRICSRLRIRDHSYTWT